ncbi:MAG: indole-3-glycerol phosphate synthase TrpC [Clostridia bacterium]|jgi:indole-3-glycerol phosphate synthase
MILDEIVEKKHLELIEETKQISIEGFKRKLSGEGSNPVQSFYEAIKRDNEISIIAEVKKASPSKGIIKDDFDALAIARDYYKSDVQALSVLTEKNYFLGSNENLITIRQAIPLPILRKDFIIDMWQIYQSRYLGADAILLITSILTDTELSIFQIVASILGMQCLVEVHNREEIERALESGAKIIGINNRDLNTFNVDLKTTEKLINYIPHDRAVVSESGISTSVDIRELKRLGVDAVLIGEAFMRSRSILKKVAEFKA